MWCFLCGEAAQKTPHPPFLRRHNKSLLKGIIMCRSIKQLRQAEYRPSDEEINAAALQFVRKVSGYRVPSRLNQAAFNQAVVQIAAATRTLLDNLDVRAIV